ncbi:MAG: 3-oxoacyl-ACP reductase FabG [Alistipes sp.]|nr:3-oxoacyl-ACP reductase FabG [Alistipes sp.]
MNSTKYALVTGASRGIGRAIAIKLASQGYSVIINYASNSEAAQQTLNDIVAAGGQAELLPFDVSSSESVASALDSWRAAHEGEHISVVVNNAGIRKDNLMMWMPEAEWRSVLSTSLDGFFNVTQPLLKDMLVHKWGRIVNVASLSGIKGMPGQANYSAAKGGLIAATKALAQEVAKKRVTVNAVAPGFIKSDMTADLNEAELKKLVPAGRFGEAEEVAELVAFLVSDAAAYITGEVISINGGIYT